MTTDSIPIAPDVRRSAATRVVLTVIAGTVMIPLDVTVVAVALARLSEETGASLPVIQWVSTGYTLALASVIPLAAWAIGRHGARRVFLAAIAVFTLGSLLVATAWDAPSLIGFRVVQGLGGGFVMPAAMTLALRAAAPEDRGRVMSLLGLPILVGPVFGPPLGGWLLDTLSWRWIFLVNLPVGLVALWLGRRNLPASEPGPAGPLDRRGLVLLPPAMALLVFGASRLEGTTLDAVAVFAVGAAAVLVAAFVRHALRTPDPLLRIRLLRRRATGGGALLLVLFAGGYFATLILVPLYYQAVRGETATTTGLLMMPQAVVAGITIQLSGRLVDRIEPVRVIASGITAAVIGYAAFAWQLSAEASYVGLVAALAVGAGGAGATMLPTMTLATRRLDDGDIPSGSTMINVLNQLATSVATAAVSVIAAAALAARVPDLPGGFGALQATSPQLREQVAPAAAEALRLALLVPLGGMTAALLVALLVLPGGRQVKDR